MRANSSNKFRLQKLVWPRLGVVHFVSSFAHFKYPVFEPTVRIFIKSDGGLLFAALAGCLDFFRGQPLKLVPVRIFVAIIVARNHCESGSSRRGKNFIYISANT